MFQSNVGGHLALGQDKSIEFDQTYGFNRTGRGVMSSSIRTERSLGGRLVLLFQAGTNLPRGISLDDVHLGHHGQILEGQALDAAGACVELVEYGGATERVRVGGRSRPCRWVGFGVGVMVTMILIGRRNMNRLEFLTLFFVAVVLHDLLFQPKRPEELIEGIRTAPKSSPRHRRLLLTCIALFGGFLVHNLLGQVAHALHALAHIGHLVDEGSTSGLIGGSGVGLRDIA